MAITFEHKGKTYRADTAKEAAELRKLLEHQDADQGVHGRQSKFWTADQATDLLNGLGQSQKKLLSILANGSSVPTDILVSALDLESEVALAGVVSGLSKQVRRFKVNPHDLYVVEVDWDGKEKSRYFRMIEDFRLVLDEIGWPEAWEKPAPK